MNQASNRQKTIKLSRRHFLVGMGVLGLGASAGACGGLALASYWNVSQLSPEIVVVESDSTPRYPRPAMISRDAWGALPPNYSARTESGFYSASNRNGWRVYDVPLTDIYRTVVMHHAAFYSGTDAQTVLDIQTLHRTDRGWADVGYHFMVGQNGMIYEGRDIQARGTHVGGFNTGSLGICLLGNFMEQSPTELQLNSALALINWASEYLALSHIATHRDFNAGTQCPGDNLAVYIDQFANASGLSIGTDGYRASNTSPSCLCCDCVRAI